MYPYCTLFQPTLLSSVLASMLNTCRSSKLMVVAKKSSAQIVHRTREVAGLVGIMRGTDYKCGGVPLLEVLHLVSGANAYRKTGIDRRNFVRSWIVPIAE